MMVLADFSLILLLFILHCFFLGFCESLTAKLVSLKSDGRQESKEHEKEAAHHNGKNLVIARHYSSDAVCDRNKFDTLPDLRRVYVVGALHVAVKSQVLYITHLDRVPDESVELLERDAFLLALCQLLVSFLQEFERGKTLLDIGVGQVAAELI